MKNFIKSLPVVGPIARGVYRALFKKEPQFSGSQDYWVNRYAAGGNSGAGSYDRLAEFKAKVINDFVQAQAVQTVIEYGCGDGNQLKLARYPRYLGLDISEKAIALCRSIFQTDSTKKFALLKDYAGETAQLTLSLDVLYHLVEDAVFHDYMERLFDSSERYVIVYSSDSDVQKPGQSPHVRHRKFTDWIKAQRAAWELQQFIPNQYPLQESEITESFADIYIYRKPGTTSP